MTRTTRPHYPAKTIRLITERTEIGYQNTSRDGSIELWWVLKCFLLVDNYPPLDQLPLPFAALQMYLFKLSQGVLSMNLGKLMKKPTTASHPQISPKFPCLFHNRFEAREALNKLTQRPRLVWSEDWSAGVGVAAHR